MTVRLRALGLGLGAAGAYVAVAVATMQLGSRPVRPLFDGFAPPVPYRWVKPPPELAPDNRQPEAIEVTVAVDGERGSDAATATTPDNQAVTGLEAGAVPPHPPDAQAKVTVTPLDAATLGPLPPERTAQSNAYRVSIAYQPSGDALAGLARPGTVALTSAGPADGLLFSADGQRWEPKAARPYGQGHGLSGALEATGWYLAVSSPPPPEDEGGSGGPNLALVIVALAGVPLVLGWLLLGRRKPASRGPGGRTPGRGGRRSPAGALPPARSGSATKPKPKARKKRKPPPKKRR